MLANCPPPLPCCFAVRAAHRRTHSSARGCAPPRGGLCLHDHSNSRRHHADATRCCVQVVTAFSELLAAGCCSDGDDPRVLSQANLQTVGKLVGLQEEIDTLEDPEAKADEQVAFSYNPCG